jgi:glycogen phosphorylase
VTPCDSTEKLARLAYNLRWTWHLPTSDLFRRIAPVIWDATHNPVAILRAVERDPKLLAAHAEHVAAAETDLSEYLDRAPDLRDAPGVAYFSAEFAIGECLPLYSGGLGVLAGDYLKAASDLGLPVIGVGLLYKYGYFRQWISGNGRQQELYDRLDTNAVPLRPAMAADGVPLETSVPFPRRTVLTRAWLAQVGRIPLYLLDTDLPGNSEDDRWITGHLYGGDEDTRLRQEIVLGIGGARLIETLKVLGRHVAPGVYHLNEGHSALVALERTARRMRTSSEKDFFTAFEQVAESTVFTTHTPVSAGHDTFPPALIEAHLSEYREHLGLSHRQFMALGRSEPDLLGSGFSMTVLGLRSSHARNAVSQVHAALTRRLWSGIGVGACNIHPRIEMDAITNGVHTSTWAGPEMSVLFDRSLGYSWRVSPQHRTSWAAIPHVELDALWAARTAQRSRLLKRLDATLRADGADGMSPEMTAEHTLVVGLARRFATYKRAGLLLQDPERLARLLDGPARPIVVVFAGKAHPHDEPGKLILQQVVEASRDPRFRGRIVFLANYDFELARFMVQGSDVWLNTPRPPYEASGTSGMKATLNGALHVSELDGWWTEAFVPEVGWALGEGVSDQTSEEVRDKVEAVQLMELLEDAVVPLFFDRDRHGRPVHWLTRVQRSIEALAGQYSAHRMVEEYVERIYRPVAGPAGDPVSVVDGTDPAALVV